MTYCIEIPELKIDNSQIAELKNFYYENEDTYGITYKSKKETVTELTIVGGYKKSEIIKNLESKIDPKYIDASYFVSNYGISAHTDDNRQCIISFEISNDENIPINFHHLNKIEEKYYNKIPLMWNPQIEHSANNSRYKRIFFQIELKRDLIFKQYLELYQTNKLLL